MFTYYKNPKTGDLIIFDEEEENIFIAQEFESVEYEEEKEEERSRPKPKTKKKHKKRGKKGDRKELIPAIKRTAEILNSMDKKKITQAIITQIQTARADGELNKSKLARELGISEAAVRKYWRPKEPKKKELDKDGFTKI